jgi:hypothetical protein
MTDNPAWLAVALAKAAAAGVASGFSRKSSDIHVRE